MASHSIPSAFLHALGQTSSYLSRKRLLVPVLFTSGAVSMLGFFALWATLTKGAVVHADAAEMSVLGSRFQTECNLSPLYHYPPEQTLPSKPADRIPLADVALMPVNSISTAIAGVAFLVPIAAFASRFLIPYTPLESNAMALSAISTLSAADRATELGAIASNIFENGLQASWTWLTLSSELLITAYDGCVIAGAKLALDKATKLPSTALTIEAVKAYWADQNSANVSNEFLKVIKKFIPFDSLYCEVEVPAPISNTHYYSLPTLSDTHQVLAFCQTLFTCFCAIAEQGIIGWMLWTVLRFFCWPLVLRFKLGRLVKLRPRLINYSMFLVVNSSDDSQIAKDLYSLLLTKEEEEMAKRARATVAATATGSNDAAGRPTTSGLDLERGAFTLDAASLNTLTTDDGMSSSAFSTPFIEMEQSKKAIIVSSGENGGSEESEITGCEKLGIAETPVPMRKPASRALGKDGIAFEGFAGASSTVAGNVRGRRNPFVRVGRVGRAIGSGMKKLVIRVGGQIWSRLQQLVVLVGGFRK